MRLPVLLVLTVSAAALSACSPDAGAVQEQSAHADDRDAGMDHGAMQPAETGAPQTLVEAMAGEEAAPGTQTVDAQGQLAQFQNAWIRTPPAGRDIAAAYVTITTREADAVLRVQSEAATRVELHTMSMDGNVMRMRRIERLETGPDGAVLQPGGDHIMIFGLSETAQLSGTVDLTFYFESGLTAENIEFQIASEMPGE